MSALPVIEVSLPTMAESTPNLRASAGAIFPVGQFEDATHVSVAHGDQTPPAGARIDSPPTRHAPLLVDPALYMLAQTLNDLEGLRKAQANRLRILTRIEPDVDGVMRGFGLTEDHPGVQSVAMLLDASAGLEAATIKEVQKHMRKHPLWTRYGKTAKGVGEKQLARLLAAIGDPYLKPVDGGFAPRTVSQLWAYCGLHTLPADQMSPDTQHGCVGGVLNVAAKRRKGQQANWSTEAKTRAYLIATSAIKTNGELRQVYDNRRAHTAVTHPEWTPGHSHNDALRIVSKHLLKQLWRAARDFYAEVPA